MSARAHVGACVAVEDREPAVARRDRAHADLDRMTRIDQPLTHRGRDEAAVRDRALAVVPGVLMCVELHERQRTVAIDMGAQAAAA